MNEPLKVNRENKAMQHVINILCDDKKKLKARISELEHERQLVMEDVGPLTYEIWIAEIKKANISKEK